MTLGWGITGTGRIVRDHMLTALNADPEGHVLGVVSHTPERARQLASEHHVRWWHDLEEMLADPDLDAVYIAGRHHEHAGQVQLACAAGKHVLCEKPLATTAVDAQLAVETAERHGVILAVNHPLRGLTSFQTIRQAVARGDIGQPISARVVHTVELEIPAGSWRRVGPSAGVLLDVSVHSVDCLRFVLDGEVEEVYAVGTFDDGWEAPGTTMLLLRMDGGILASLHDSFSTPSAGNGLEVHGYGGSLIADGVIGGLQPASSYVIRRPNRPDVLWRGQPEEALFAPTIRAFTEAVLRDGTPLAPGRDHLRTLQVIFAAQHSLTPRGRR